MFLIFKFALSFKVRLEKLSLKRHTIRLGIFLLGFFWQPWIKGCLEPPGPDAMGICQGDPLIIITSKLTYIPPLILPGL